ncbi:hypothetical protein WJX72_011399 [[Myrmecia] bisecta]|uniref:Uncharacterized protein n=1 Tax=[Myrmecia] bisecta TaxID=41462 RepID=A0AAW1PUP7_9CHLO
MWLTNALRPRSGSLCVLLVLLWLAPGEAYYCPGDEIPDNSVETQTLCDGTVTTCAYACCVGDYCIQCNCKSATLTKSEAALQTALCTALSNATNADNFCSGHRQIQAVQGSRIQSHQREHRLLPCISYSVAVALPAILCIPPALACDRRPDQPLPGQPQRKQPACPCSSTLPCTRAQR